MNLSQLIEEVNKDLDDTLPNDEITGWLNRAIDDLTPHAKYRKEEVITLLPDQKQYVLPADLIEIVFLMDEERRYEQVNMEDFYSSGYKRWGDKLTFQPTPKEEKEVSLYYFARLPHLENGDDEPLFPSQYHELLVLYAVGRAKYQDEEESMSNNAMQEYLAKRDQFIAFNQSGDSYSIQEVAW